MATYLRNRTVQAEDSLKQHAEEGAAVDCIPSAVYEHDAKRDHNADYAENVPDEGSEEDAAEAKALLVGERHPQYRKRLSEEGERTEEDRQSPAAASWPQELLVELRQKKVEAAERA